MPPPKPFKAIETPDLTYKEGIKSPPRPLAAPTKSSVTAPMSTATSATMTVPAPSQAAKPTNRRNHLKDKWGNITGRVLDYLDGVDEQGRPRLDMLLAETKLKDIAIFAGIGTEKVLLLEGQPTAIIGQAEQKKMDELLPALMQEMKRRGVKAELSERKVELTMPGQS